MSFSSKTTKSQLVIHGVIEDKLTQFCKGLPHSK